MLEPRPHDGIDGRQHFRVVQPILGLPLKLRLGHEHADDPGQPFANIFGRQRHAFRRQIVRVDVVAHRLAESARANRFRACRPTRSGYR